MKLQLIIGGCIAVALGAVGYSLFVAGRGEGVDFVAAIQNGQIQPANVGAVRILVPPIGHTPFSEAEMASLECTASITSRGEVEALLSGLANAKRGRIDQNHPVTTYHGYWQVELTGGGRYYLYVDVLKDTRRSVCCVAASRKDATNPNGAVPYYLDDFRTLLRTARIVAPE